MIGVKFSANEKHLCLSWLCALLIDLCKLGKKFDGRGRNDCEKNRPCGLMPHYRISRKSLERKLEPELFILRTLSANFRPRVSVTPVD